MRRLAVPLVALAAASAFACADRKSAAGFRLPDGDPARGQAVFAEMKCHSCHRVAGMDKEFPAPVADPPVPVVLGGQVPHARTDGELVTAIIHPSWRVASVYQTELQTKGGVRNRMPDYSQVMTVRQMIDLVAFLQSRYEVVRPPAPMGR